MQDTVIERVAYMELKTHDNVDSVLTFRLVQNAR